MKRAIEVIKKVAKESNKVILFHSMSGKDSIALLDLMHSYFDEIICVYMYVVRDLSHINRYMNYINRKYPKARVFQVPHFSLSSYLKFGYLGCDKNENQKIHTFKSITDFIRDKTGAEWAAYGFKQSDSLNRRLMLRGYEDQSISLKTKKVYPLSEYKNEDVLNYIDQNRLIQPERYSNEQSSGTSIDDIHYLLYLRERFPNDLKKIFKQFPLSERKLFEYDHGNKTE